MLHRTAEGLEHQLPRHPSFFDNSSRTKFFAPLPEHIHGSFVAISPLNGRLSELDKLWSILTMDPEFETATIVFSGNYLCGPHARHLLSLLCTLRLAHPSPIFLSGPNDLAAAAYLGLLKNLELSVALNAVGTTWAEENHEVFTSYGVTSRTATDLLTAMPPEHREFLTELAVSVKHDDVTLTAMPATTLAASSLTSEFASDFFTLPHPELHPPTSSALSNTRDSTQATSSPSAARSSGAAAADSGDVESDERHQRTHSGGSGTGGAQTGQMEIQPQVDARMTEATPKTMYVDPIAEFPGINADGLALNGSGLLAALFYPSGRVVVASLDGPRH